MKLFNILAILITLSAGFSYLNYRFIGLPNTIGLMVIALLVSLGLAVLGPLGFGLKEEAFRLLASEQLALIDIETGDTDAAINRYQAILSDAEVSADLQQRALQVIVALGGQPDLEDTGGLNGNLLPETDN